MGRTQTEVSGFEDTGQNSELLLGKCLGVEWGKGLYGTRIPPVLQGCVGCITRLV